MSRHRISSSKAPAAGGPYSQAIEANGFVFCAGQIGTDPTTGKLVEGGTGAQARQVLRNLAAVLETAGMSLSDVVKTTCFLADINDFAEFNEAYAGHFTDAPPARSTFQVAALPGGARVEIEAIAVRPEV